MAAVTGLQLGTPPPARKRRGWLVGLVFGWMAVVVIVGTWSVWHSPPTVPEQRDIAQAVPELQRAAGVVYAAASGDKRVVVLGDLELIGDCRITPVRHGYVAARDLTVYVRAGTPRTCSTRSPTRCRPVTGRTWPRPGAGRGWGCTRTPGTSSGSTPAPGPRPRVSRYG